MGFYAAGDAEIVQMPHDLMIDGDGARLVVDVAQPVDRQGAEPMAAKQTRGTAPDGPKPITTTW